MKSAKIKSLEIKIAKLVEDAISGFSNEKSIVVLNKITKSEASKIKKQTGISLEDYYRIIDNYSILHTLNSHGNDSNGQLPITKLDFRKIPQIVLTDNIIYRGKNKSGCDVLLYEAKIGEKFYYAEEIRKGKKQLVLNSMWKRKK